MNTKNLTIKKNSQVLSVYSKKIVQQNKSSLNPLAIPPLGVLSEKKMLLNRLKSTEISRNLTDRSFSHRFLSTHQYFNSLCQDTTMPSAQFTPPSSLLPRLDCFQPKYDLLTMVANRICCSTKSARYLNNWESLWTLFLNMVSSQFCFRHGSGRSC